MRIGGLALRRFASQQGGGNANLVGLEVLAVVFIGNGARDRS